MIVPRGGGYVAFTANGGGYRKTKAEPVGTKEMQIYRDGRSGMGYHALVGVDPTAEQTDVTIEITVAKSTRITGRVVGPDEKPFTASYGYYSGAR